MVVKSHQPMTMTLLLFMPCWQSSSQ